MVVYVQTIQESLRDRFHAQEGFKALCVGASNYDESMWESIDRLLVDSTQLADSFQGTTRKSCICMLGISIRKVNYGHIVI